MGKHYVPRAYLNGFCHPDSPGVIWMYDKQRDEFAHASVKQVAQERDFYPPEVEEKLTHLVERPAYGALQKLRQGQPIDVADRASLALYIGTMLKRVPHSRLKGLEKVPEVLEGTLRDVKDFIERGVRANRLDPLVAARRIDEVDAIGEKYRETPPPEVLEQLQSPWPSEEVVRLIFNMTWRLVRTEGPSYFLTTDNPAFFFECYGLGNQESELTFTLSSHLALVANWQPGDVGPVLDKRQQLVKEINRRVASTATRFLFYRQREDWVAEVGKKKNHFLSQIQW